MDHAYYLEEAPFLQMTSAGESSAGTMRRHGFARDALIETLHTVQEYFGYLDKPSLKFVAASLRVPLSQAYGVATFLSLLHVKAARQAHVPGVFGHGLLHQRSRPTL